MSIKPEIPSAYLGDSVYAIDDDGTGIQLCLNSHDDSSTVIYLEGYVIKELEAFIAKWRKHHEHK